MAASLDLLSDEEWSPRRSAYRRPRSAPRLVFCSGFSPCSDLKGYRGGSPTFAQARRWKSEPALGSLPLQKETNKSRAPERFFFDKHTYTGVHRRSAPSGRVNGSTGGCSPGPAEGDSPSSDLRDVVRPNLRSGSTSVGLRRERRHPPPPKAKASPKKPSVAGHLRCGRASPPQRGPETLFYDTKNYTGTHRYRRSGPGSPTAHSGPVGQAARAVTAGVAAPLAGLSSGSKAAVTPACPPSRARRPQSAGSAARAAAALRTRPKQQQPPGPLAQSQPATQRPRSAPQGGRQQRCNGSQRGAKPGCPGVPHPTVTGADPAALVARGAAAGISPPEPQPPPPPWALPWPPQGPVAKGEAAVELGSARGQDPLYSLKLSAARARSLKVAVDEN